MDHRGLFGGQGAVVGTLVHPLRIGSWGLGGAQGLSERQGAGFRGQEPGGGPPARLNFADARAFGATGHGDSARVSQNPVGEGLDADAGGQGACAEVFADPAGQVAMVETGGVLS